MSVILKNLCHKFECDALISRLISGALLISHFLIFEIQIRTKVKVSYPRRGKSVGIAPCNGTGIAEKSKCTFWTLLN